MPSILFVCLGNICRSPIAEACLRQIVKDKQLDWKVDSAGTANYHFGKSPDYRALTVIKNHYIDFQHSARQLVEDDFFDYDYILAMDNMNLEEIMDITPKNSKAKIDLLGKWWPNKNDKHIRDPYYDKGIESFEEVYQKCYKCCVNFVEDITSQNKR